MTVSRVVFGIAALFVVAFTTWMGWYELHPQGRGCAQSIKLCKPPDAQKADTDCREVLADIATRLGSSDARAAGQCMLDSQSCNESLSCLAHADRRSNAMKKK